jgi:NADPH:quinone reductase-like Zn-dependent oxidoreductase
MKAIVQHRYGAPQDVLHLAEVEMPVAGAEDVLVSVRASSANPWDWHFIRGEPLLFRPAGLGGVRKPKFPVPGGDLAGTVERPAAPSRRSSRAMRCTVSATAPSPST